jgi:hypothetical protein
MQKTEAGTIRLSWKTMMTAKVGLLEQKTKLKHDGIWMVRMMEVAVGG